VKFTRKVVEKWPPAITALWELSVLELLSRWIREDALSVRRAAARLFCDGIAQVSLFAVLFESSILESLLVLLADLDGPWRAERIIGCIGTLLERAILLEWAEMVLVSFEKSGIWERLEELAHDPDATIGEGARNRVWQVIRQKEKLIELQERQTIAEEKRKEAEVLAMRDLVRNDDYDEECGLYGDEL
jgi:hypothetical protein